MNADERSRSRLLRVAALGLGLAALVSLAARAYVNPNFTPKHLEAQAKLICAVKVAAIAADGRGAELEVVEVIKGKTEARRLKVDFAEALGRQDGKERVGELVELLKSAGARPAMLATGDFEGRECALLHVEAAWLRLDTAADGGLRFDRADPTLNGTFNGGTDMLIGTMRFILKFPNAPIMPVGGGVTWQEHTLLGKLPGPAEALLAVDADGDGRLDVFAACSQGDRLFLNRKDGKFEETSPGSASLAAAWADFDGDGRADLASLSADGLKVWFQKEAGKFTAVQYRLGGKVETASATLWAVDVGGDGRMDLVVGAGAAAILVNADGKGAFEARALPEPEKRAELGLAGPCVAADFDGDGLPDVLQTYQKGGAFWKGKAGGGFDAVPDCGALMGNVRSRRPVLADLDGDGLLDVLLVGGDRTPLLLQNRGGGKFEEVIRQTGETFYIIQSGAASAAAGDFNNDTFVDLFVGYAEEPGQFFFNRGFRSFAICEPLKFRDDDVEDASKGQTAGCWADLDGNGSLELITALASGALWMSRSSLDANEEPQRIAARLDPAGGPAGPTVVRFYLEGRCLGARLADRWAGPAVLGVAEPGQYQVKWRTPDGREHVRTVETDARKVEVVIGAPDPAGKGR